MAHEVFISYSSQDKDAAEAVCAKLESEGIKCWIAPRDIQPSATYAQSIINGISASSLMILVVSSHASESKHIESEIDRAYNKRIPIIPLRIEDVPLTGSLEYYLSTAQWFDALTPPLGKHLEKLPGVVRQLLKTDVDAAPSTAGSPPMPTARLQPQSSRRGFFSSLTFKLIAGLLLVAIAATIAVLWLLPTRKTKSEVTGENQITATDEIITDSRNNLMWTKNQNGADINWQDAVKYCDDLALGGFNDWRLPSRLDLYATNDSDIPESDRIWKSFQLEKTCCYWTSSEENENRALAYNLKSDIQALDKTDKEELRALCVHHSGK